MACKSWIELNRLGDYLSWDELDQCWYVKLVDSEGVYHYLPLHFCPLCGEKVGREGCLT